MLSALVREEFLTEIEWRTARSRSRCLVLLLASMVSLAASVVAEPFVPTPLPALGMRPGERDHSLAVLAADEVAA
jgi:hypothetical protein